MLRQCDRCDAGGRADVAAQELELKQKQLDLEKAKIEQQKAAELSLEKASEIDVEQQKLELEKARQALAVKEICRTSSRWLFG